MAINTHCLRELLVLFAAAVLAAMALLGVLAGSSRAVAGDTTLVSVSSSGTEGNGNSSGGSFSADGRYVAFSSLASNLVADDTNNNETSEGYDVFVRDRQEGTTERVSVDSSGAQAENGNSSSGSISADGRYVAFGSNATNLVADDNNGKADVFVHDRNTGTTERVSVDSYGAQANDFRTNYPELGSRGASISADGRYVAFGSNATNLVPGDTNNTDDVFVRDRQEGTTERVSVSSSETQANDFGENDPQFGSRRASISADGRYVAFASVAEDLLPVEVDLNGGDDAFVRDRQLGTTERVSVDSCGIERENTASHPLVGLSMSADGRYVGFGTYARNLVPGDSGVNSDAFVHDRDTGTTELVSVNSSRTKANGTSTGPSISADGRYAAFNSNATNLVSGQDPNVYLYDVFVHERRDTTQQSEKCPPTATASATTVDSGAAYEPGTWTNEDVEVTLSAQDNQGGSGVKEITYSATGSHQIASTTVPGSSASVPVTTEGETTISYFATDKAGNRSPTKTFTVKIDKTAPTVIKTSPSDQQTGVRRSKTITATFFEAMASNSLGSASVSLYKGTSTTPVDATVNYDAATKTVKLDPSNRLAARTRYTMKISGAKDLAGKSLPGYQWSFKTGRK